MSAPHESRHILSSFDRSLEQLREALSRMALLAEDSFNSAARALARRDEDLCNRIIAEDEEADVLEKKIDAEGIHILTRYTPLAHDFRRVFTTMKAATDFERVCDKAVSIARRTKRLIHTLELRETRMLEPVFDAAAGLLHDAIRAYFDEDRELATGLKARDRKLDELHHNFVSRITRRMEEDAPNAQGYLDLVLIARNIERVGDHAVNIGEDSVFSSSAVDIRHEREGV
jgi:phosphate transport system protein